MLPICAPPRSSLTRSLAGITLALGLCHALGCHAVVSGVDPEALGYGSASATLAGYDVDPVPRPRVAGWTPPERGESATSRSARNGQGARDPNEAVPYTAEVIELCDALDALDADQARPACLHRYRIARLFRSLDKWKGLINCVGQAKELETIPGCERDNPPVFVLGDSYERETTACMHMLALSIVEHAGAAPMMSAAELQSFEPSVHECVDGLVSTERDELGPKRYFEKLDCIDAAETTQQAQDCG